MKGSENTPHPAAPAARPPSPTRGEGRAALLALFAFLVGGPALAQTSDTIVVTAERRPQAADTLAGNTAALEADALARIDAQAPSEALNRLPGVAIHRNNGVENLPAIRSPVLNGGQSAGSFLMLEDGSPIRAAGFSNVNQVFETSFDLADRVEVVRGPGSALYGSNAVHGIVNVITPTPGIKEDRGGLTVEAGSFGRFAASGWEAFGTREGAVDNNQLGYIGLALNHSDGWRKDSDLSQQHLLAGFDSYLGNWNLESRLVLQNLNQQSAGFIVGENAYDSTTRARSNPTPGAFRDQQLARARITLSRELSPDWRIALTASPRWIESNLQLFFVPSRAREETSQTGSGFQAIAYWDASDALSLIFGADADITRGEVREEQTLPDQPNGYLQGLHYDYDVDMTTAALYAQARWQFAQDWALTAGLRGERISYEYDNHAPDGDFGRFRRAADREDDFSSLTPKLGLVWTPMEGNAFWLNLARGQRPPQITDLYSLQTNQTPGAQDVETLDSAELGWRGALGPARVEVALYHMDKRDTSFRNADGFTVTDGRTRHQGIEVSATAPIGDAFELSGWVTYARHTYRFSDPSSRDGDSIRAGDDVDTAPRIIANTRALWHANDALDLELEWVHMGRYFTNAENTRRYPGHDVFNLRADWDVSERITLFGAVRNLANTDYAERADFAFGDDRYFPGEDRAFTIGVRARH